MKSIGLTGGIATGKSAVSQLLKSMGIPIIDADIVAREIVEKGRPALREIEHVFGKSILCTEGRLNREKLGEIIFSDKEKREILNNIMHTRIIKEIINKIELYRNEKRYVLVVVDAPLLIEVGMKKLVDEVWVVVTSEQVQINRLMSRNHISKEDAKRRIDSQMPLEEKKQYADVIIDNNHSLIDLEREVKKIVSKVK